MTEGNEQQTRNQAQLLRVLLIENDTADVELNVRELEKAGFEVSADVVDTPEQFQERLSSNTYDIVLSDYKLPGWNGMQALETLKQRGKDSPFILVTGALGEEAAVAFMKRGASDYVLKDHLARLPLAVEKALEERALRAEGARAEQLVHDREDRFRALIENSSDGIALLGIDGTFLYSSPTTQRILGYSVEEFSGRNIFELIHPDDVENATFLFHELLQQSGSPKSYQLRYRHKNGSWRWIEGVGTNLLGESSVRAIVANYRDITERKQAEEEIRKLNEELERRVIERTAQLEAANRELQVEIVRRERAQAEQDRSLRQSEAAEKRFRSVLESAPDAMAISNSDGYIVLVNRQTEQMFGYLRDELLGKPVDILVLERFRSEYLEYRARCCLTRPAREMGTGLDLYARRKDGSEFPVEISLSPMESDGKILVTNVIRDITERRAMERMKDEFISVVSHELRTPLTSIRGALGLVANGRLGALPERSQRMIEIAVANTDRLVRLINDILDIERMESGKVAMAKQDCDTAHLVGQAADVMQAMAQKAGVQLVVDAQSHSVWADPDRVIQTLTNLLSNAIKFSPANTTIWLSAEKRVDEILFRVKDQGRGIPPDKLESIFERFQQVDASDSREKGGTGLGLSICRSIMQQHEGRIWVESAPGQGSTFFATLPAPRDAGRDSAHRKPLVLVCDDDSTDRSTARVLLERQGYRVATVAAGEEAVESCGAERPAAILLDLMMPGMDGWETMAALKLHANTKDIPIIIYSSLSPDETQASAPDFVGWVRKPLGEVSLLRALSSALRG